MKLNQRIAAFVKLGAFIKQFSTSNFIKDETLEYNDRFESFSRILHQQKHKNSWFTIEELIFANQSWSNALTEERLKNWLSVYNITNKTPKTVALILAGNIPYVGLHDVISVLISGNKVLMKCSSKDNDLIPFLMKCLIDIEPSFKDYISLTEQKLENFNAVIATGSSNTARYFEYYFKNYPNIIRKTRNSVAVLTGKENKEELIALGSDIFRYFGLGCRSVSKIFIPNDYDFTLLFEALYEYKDCIYYEKYANNYDYNKAVFLMSDFKLLDNEFIILKEDERYGSPIASLFYEKYSDLEVLKTKLKTDESLIQCIVSQPKVIDKSVDFGTTQTPNLYDYADQVDTIKFLTELV